MARILTVNSGGAVYKSDDSGVNWSSLSTVASTTDKPAVIYGNGTWSYSNYTNGAIQYSTNNGSSWSNGSGISSKNPIDGCYANGIFVIITSQGYAYTSTDGITYTERTMPASGKNLRGLYWKGDGFACFPYNYGYVFYSDANGQNWQQYALASGQYGSSLNWDNVAYNGTTYVAVSRASTNKILYSSNGLDWTTTTTGTPTISWLGVATNGSRFVACGDNTANAYISDNNGASWSAVDLGQGSSRWFGGIVWDGTNFVTPKLGSSVVRYSPTGSASSWSSGSGLASANWFKIATDYTPSAAPSYKASQFFSVM